MYVGIDGLAKKVKNMYVGVNGIARKVKKAYIGIGNVARLFFSSGFKYLGSSLTGELPWPGDVPTLYKFQGGVCNFKNKLCFRITQYFIQYDKDLQVSVSTLSQVDSLKASVTGKPKMVSDENHMLTYGLFFDRPSYFYSGYTECFDTDFVRSALPCGGYGEGVAGKLGDFFLCGGGYEGGVGRSSYAVFYDRETLTHSYVSAFFNNSEEDLYGFSDGDMTNTKNYLVTHLGLGSGSGYRPLIAMAVDSEKIKTFIPVPKQKYGYSCISIGGKAFFAGGTTYAATEDIGRQRNCASIDDDLVYSNNIQLPKARETLGMTMCGSLGVILGGEGASPDTAFKATYDFDIIDSDFVFSKPDFEKMKYRRQDTIAGTIGDKLLIFSDYADDLEETENINTYIPNCRKTAEVYEF